MRKRNGQKPGFGSRAFLWRFPPRLFLAMGLWRLRNLRAATPTPATPGGPRRPGAALSAAPWRAAPSARSPAIGAQARPSGREWAQRAASRNEPLVPLLLRPMHGALMLRQRLLRVRSLLQVSALSAVLLSTGAAEAQQATNPSTAGGKRVPMHPSTLTLKTGHGRGHRRPIHPHYPHARLHQATPVHGTFVGPRI